MKNFEEIKKKRSLIDFADSKFGNMYSTLNISGEESYMIRHIGNELTPELLPIYVELYNAILQYIENHPKIKEYVFMPELIEVGMDYIIRPFYMYIVSTKRYFDPDEPLEPPKEYYKMVNAFSEEMINQFSIEDITSPNRESIIKRVLRKSLMQPRGKTFIESRYINKCVIVEPSISIEDIEEWVMLQS